MTKVKTLLIFLVSALFVKTDIVGKYNSWQCGQITLELNPDSSFQMKYTHFDIDYSRISTGKYKIKGDTLTLVELKKHIVSRGALDTIHDKTNTHSFIIEDNGRLKNKSLYCGELSSRESHHWAFFEKES